MDWRSGTESGPGSQRPVSPGWGWSAIGAILAGWVWDFGLYWFFGPMSDWLAPATIRAVAVADYALTTLPPILACAVALAFRRAAPTQAFWQLGVILLLAGIDSWMRWFGLAMASSVDLPYRIAHTFPVEEALYWLAPFVGCLAGSAMGGCFCFREAAE